MFSKLTQQTPEPACENGNKQLNSVSVVHLTPGFDEISIKLLFALGYEKEGHLLTFIVESGKLLPGD